MLTVLVNRELARWLPVLPSQEVKALLAMMLQADPAGALRTSPDALAARLGTSPGKAEDLFDRLARRRLIVIEPQDTYLRVVIRGFLGVQDAPPDAPVPTCA